MRVVPYSKTAQVDLKPNFTYCGELGRAGVKAFASHQCGPGSIPGHGVILCGLNLLLVLVLAPRDFCGFSGFPPCTKTNTSKFQFDRELEGHKYISRKTFTCSPHVLLHELYFFFRSRIWIPLRSNNRTINCYIQITWTFKLLFVALIITHYRSHFYSDWSWSNISHLSIKSNSHLLWFCIITLSGWLKINKKNDLRLFLVWDEK